MNILNIPLLAAGLLLLAVGTARAQTAAPAPTSTPITIQRDVLPPPPPNPMLTAADSARERSRQANAAALRKQASKPPAKVATNVSLSPMEGTAAKPASMTNATPEEAARVREQEEREMLNHAKTKKGHKQAKKTTHTIKKLDRAGESE